MGNVHALLKEQPRAVLSRVQVDVQAFCQQRHQELQLELSLYVALIVQDLSGLLLLQAQATSAMAHSVPPFLSYNFINALHTFIPPAVTCVLL
jgi:hypothetical protein